MRCIVEKIKTGEFFAAKIVSAPSQWFKSSLFPSLYA